MNIRDVRKKIKTVTNVRKITNAMHMVSAVKMKKAQRIAREGQEYREILFSMLHQLLGTQESKELKHPLITPSSGTRKLHILISSNKGLCGAFNTKLFQHVLSSSTAQTDDFITLGQKGAQCIAHSGMTITADFSHVSRDEVVTAIYKLAESAFLSEKYESVTLDYTSFVSTMKSRPTRVQIMPLTAQNMQQDIESKTPIQYSLEPAPEVLLPRLIQDYIRERIRSAISESDASEHAARMMAMKTATDNAEDLTDSLTLMRNNLRQTQITNELLDMIAAMQT